LVQGSRDGGSGGAWLGCAAGSQPKGLFAIKSELHHGHAQQQRLDPAGGRYGHERIRPAQAITGSHARIGKRNHRHVARNSEAFVEQPFHQRVLLRRVESDDQSPPWPGEANPITHGFELSASPLRADRLGGHDRDTVRHPTASTPQQLAQELALDRPIDGGQASKRGCPRMWTEASGWHAQGAASS
jgi:hypothetical protein